MTMNDYGDRIVRFDGQAGVVALTIGFMDRAVGLIAVATLDGFATTLLQGIDRILKGRDHFFNLQKMIETDTAPHSARITLV